MAQFRCVRLFYFMQALARFATYPSCDVSCTVYLLPTDQPSNEPVHSDSGEAPYHLMTFNDYPQDASLRLTRTAASTKQPVSAQAITRLDASHRFSGHGKITCGTMAQFRFVRLFYFMQVGDSFNQVCGNHRLRSPLGLHPSEPLETSEALDVGCSLAILELRAFTMPM
ncbi:hypothetical protein HPB50_027751 [Hyalomma asiaticum]|nr:hypothetical protein HPB50_027751 [Hyalomma asiaticum]